MARGNPGRDWTRDELLIALDLYKRLDFGQIDARNEAVVELAAWLDRSPGSVGMKLGNFAHIDPDCPHDGLSAHSRLDREVFDEFAAEPERLAAEARAARRRLRDA